MKIAGKRVKVNKSKEDLYLFLKNPENFEQLMPEDVAKFEANETRFTFALKGMPEVAVKIDQWIENKKVTYISAKESLDFTLALEVFEAEENAEIEINFEGKFNPFIKVMVEKPLTNFINVLTKNVQKI